MKARWAIDVLLPTMCPGPLPEFAFAGKGEKMLQYQAISDDPEQDEDRISGCILKDSA